jgi:hypothetical protein
MSEEIQQSVSLTFNGQDVPEAIPVALDDKAISKQKRMERIAEVRAHEQLGQRILKFKAKKFGAIGDYVVSKLGVKQVGHGTIVSASENADMYIQRCDALVKELMIRNPPCDPEAIVALMQLARDFNRQLLDSGEAHVRVDRQIAGETKGQEMAFPFPPGTPMMIAVNQPPRQPAPQVEAPLPEG